MSGISGNMKEMPDNTTLPISNHLRLSYVTTPACVWRITLIKQFLWAYYDNTIYSVKVHLKCWRVSLISYLTFLFMISWRQSVFFLVDNPIKNLKSIHM